jgi:hypothetical protein
MVELYRRGNSWFVHQNSLAILPQINLVGKQEQLAMDMMNFSLRNISFIFWSVLTCPKILRHGVDSFTCPPKEVVLRSFVALKNPSPSAEFEPANPWSSGKHANHYITEYDDYWSLSVTCLEGWYSLLYGETLSTPDLRFSSSFILNGMLIYVDVLTGHVSFECDCTFLCRWVTLVKYGRGGRLWVDIFRCDRIGVIKWKLKNKSLFIPRSAVFSRRSGIVATWLKLSCCLLV